MDETGAFYTNRSALRSTCAFHHLRGKPMMFDSHERQIRLCGTLTSPTTLRRAPVNAQRSLMGTQRSRIAKNNSAAPVKKIPPNLARFVSGATFPTTQSPCCLTSNSLDRAEKQLLTRFVRQSSLLLRVCCFARLPGLSRQAQASRKKPILFIFLGECDFNYCDH